MAALKRAARVKPLVPFAHTPRRLQRPRASLVTRDPLVPVNATCLCPLARSCSSSLKLLCRVPPRSHPPRNDHSAPPRSRDVELSRASTGFQRVPRPRRDQVTWSRDSIQSFSPRHSVSAFRTETSVVQRGRRREAVGVFAGRKALPHLCTNLAEVHPFKPTLRGTVCAVLEDDDPALCPVSAIGEVNSPVRLESPLPGLPVRTWL